MPTAGIEILAAARQVGEIELIAARIKRLLVDGQARPGEIAVVFRSPQEVGGLVQRGLRPAGHSGGVRVGPNARPLAGAAGVGGAAATGPRRLAVRPTAGRAGEQLLSARRVRVAGGPPRAADVERTIRQLQIPRGRTG